MIIDIIIIGLFFVLSYEDVKSHMVSDKYTLAFTLLCVICAPNLISGVAGVVIAIFGIIANDKIKQIGSGDIIVYGGMVAYFGMLNIPLMLLIVNGILAIALCFEGMRTGKYFSDGNGIACMPFFFLSFIILKVIL